MKCSACYADNAAWTTVCVMCGEPVVPVELCPAGHILPPGVRDCPICPSMWPETTAFSGPPILRGILYVEKGRLLPGGDGQEVTFLELRDGASPLSFGQPSPDRLSLVPETMRDAVARIVVRPDGVTLCVKTGVRGGKIAYRPFSAGEQVAIGATRIRFVALDVPKWLAAKAGKSGS